MRSFSISVSAPAEVSPNAKPLKYVEPEQEKPKKTKTQVTFGSALLAGLRSGALQQAVDSMEAEEKKEEDQRGVEEG